MDNNAEDNLHIELTHQQAVLLAIESWRLNRYASEAEEHGQASLRLRYLARKIAEVVEALGIVLIDETGKPFDPGMAIDVAYFEPDPSMPEGTEKVKEMIRPIILYKGNLLTSGQAIIAKGTGLESYPSEGITNERNH